MKIALVGTAPHFIDAPFYDPEWQIWTVAGCYGEEESKAARNATINRIYEIHAPDVLVQTCEPRPGFIEFARGLGGNFFIQDSPVLRERYPDAAIFDHAKHISRFGHKRYFTSSIAWMLAEAIEALESCGDEEKVIAIWGVNMAHSSEYAYQKPGCFALMAYAEALGIKVTGCHTSELFVEMPAYGIEDPPQLFRAMKVRKKELEDKVRLCEFQEQTAVQSINFFNGALEEHEFLTKTPEELEARKKELKETLSKHEQLKDKAISDLFTFRGALENMSWMEMNYYGAG